MRLLPFAAWAAIAVAAVVLVAVVVGGALLFEDWTMRGGEGSGLALAATFLVPALLLLAATIAAAIRRPVAAIVVALASAGFSAILWLGMPG